MLIGAQPLASGPLAVALGNAVEPLYVVRGQAYNWRVRLLIDGTDYTTQLTGSLDVDREEGAAGVCGFVLYLPPGPVVPSDWKGKAVILDFISRDRDGVVTETRLFTGILSLPEWDPTWRLLSCECTDQLQQRIERLSIAQINTLTGGYWSSDLFEATTGRSHWDYAQERMQSRAASLDCSPTGEVRVTPWAAAATPHYVFGAGSTVHESVQIELQDASDATNRVEIEAQYRYSRLWQHAQSFQWQHPEASSTGIAGFCQWRVWTSDLPTTDMIESAVTGAGMELVGGVGGYKLPRSMANPCGDGNVWINTFDNLWLRASATGARRWVQQVTETYNIVLTAPGGEDDNEDTQIIERDSGTVSVESSTADEWESGQVTATNGYEDMLGESRRQSALLTLIYSGAVQMLSAHRSTTLSWDVPTDLALGVDLVHTIRLEDSALAQGKCRRIVHSIDLEGGSAVTTISVALSRGGGVSDALAVPAAPSTAMEPLPAAPDALPTQLGGRFNNPITGLPIPAYDEDRLGFSGNWDVADDLTAEQFPREFKVEAVEIPDTYRDEKTAERTVTYRVGIPNDLLEL